MKKNAIVAQSGGPSPVINASLQGVVEAAADYPDNIGTVYASWHGVEGILKEELFDIGAQPHEEIALLRNTPSAGAVGTCRYKLKADQQEDFDRIIDVCSAHNIGYFFYIGGNDSMDTANHVSALAQTRGLELTATGVPKTIDNDVGDQAFDLLDHTPGYGSAARYWAYITQIANEENRGMSPSESVSVFQAMGRKAGFIPAAARLADPRREMPLQIYLAESDYTLESMLEHVNAELSRSGRCIVVVSEGFDAGSLGETHDGFGHIEYGASKTTVAQKVINYLNEHKLNARGYVTGQVPGILQRSTSIFASPQDIEEAYQVGRKAVELGVSAGTGWMATIRRRRGGEYQPFYDRISLSAVANSQRFLPEKWICKDRPDVSDDFIRYARPLIGEDWPLVRIENGIQRFAKIEPEFIEKKLPEYIPQSYRGK